MQYRNYTLYLNGAFMSLQGIIHLLVNLRNQSGNDFSGTLQFGQSHLAKWLSQVTNLLSQGEYPLLDDPMGIQFS